MIPKMVRNAGLVGGFVGDAHAMPVHWFYNKEDILNKFPPNGLTGAKFEAPDLKETHPFWAMWDQFLILPTDLTATKGQQIVGDVILRKHYGNWGPAKNHHHCTLPAGGTTLNASCARLMMRHLNASQGKGYNKSQWLDSYIAMMTDPAQAMYQDTYAEGYHRTFFSQLTAGKPKEECADASEGSASVGALVTQPALIVYELAKDGDVARVKKVATEHLFTTAPHKSMAVVVEALVDLISDLAFSPSRPSEVGGKEDTAYCLAALSKALAVQGHDLSELLKAENAFDDIVGKKFATSCGIENSWPAALYTVAKYTLDATKEGPGGAIDAIVANTNAGGENVHRGFVVATLACMVAPKSDGLGNLVSQLAESKEIMGEADALLKL